jgi:hypothetical protein
MKLKRILISVFVIVWLIVFHYESTRTFYLEPLLQRNLPKTKFLFPPAGWIMFYNIDPTFGMVQVYGMKEGQSYLIDPHQILLTRAIGYDNIHRNALLTVLNPQMAKPFCAFLHRKFSIFDYFVVTYTQYPSLVEAPLIHQQSIVYECR